MNNAMSCGCRAGSCNGILAGFEAQRPRVVDEKSPLAERKPRLIPKINLNWKLIGQLVSNCKFILRAAPRARQCLVAVEKTVMVLLSWSALHCEFRPQGTRILRTRNRKSTEVNRERYAATC